MTAPSASGRFPHPGAFTAGIRLLTGGLALFLAAGCVAPRTAPPRAAAEAIGFDPLPVPASGFPKPDQALLDLFFRLSGTPATPEEIIEALPQLPGRRPDVSALRRLALQKKRLLLTVPADPAHLGRQLQAGIPLLLNIPPSSTLQMPVQWNRAQERLLLLSGDGRMTSMPVDDFFRTRAPVNQQAIALLNPQKPWPWTPSRAEALAIGEYWEKTGAPRKAARAYQNLLAGTPGDATAAYAHAGMGRLALQKKKTTAALQHLNAAHDALPENPRILNTLAYILATIGEDLPLANTYATQAGQLDPGNPAILETLGAIALKQGRAQDAVDHLEQAWAAAATRPLPPEAHAHILDQLIRAHHANHRPDLAHQTQTHRLRLHSAIPLPKNLP